jgi:hypothetical protein
MPKTKERSSPKVRKAPTPNNHPSPEEVALRAYQIYLERGGAPGNELEDWTRAERELLAKLSKVRRKTAPRSIAA